MHRKNRTSERINKQRIVDIDLHPTIVSAKYALEGVIKYLQEKDNPLICGKEFLTKMHVLMDRFYVEYTEASDEVVVDLLALARTVFRCFLKHVQGFLNPVVLVFLAD